MPEDPFSDVPEPGSRLAWKAPWGLILAIALASLVLVLLLRILL